MPRAVQLPDDVIGMIYESVTEDEPWQRPLERLRTMVRASNLMIRIASKGAPTRDAIFAYGPKVDHTKIIDWEERIYKELFPVNPAMGETVFFQWEQVLKSDDMVRYMHVHGSSWTITHCFESSSRGESFLIGSREPLQESFDHHDAAILRSAGVHFSKAICLRRNFLRQKLTADFQGEGLDRLGIGAIIVESDESSMPLNQTAQHVLEQGEALRQRHGRLCATDEYEDRRLQVAIRHVLGSKGDRMKARALTLSMQGNPRGLGLLIQGRQALAPASGKPDTNGIIFIRSINSAAEIDLGVTRELFGFTQAEARIAAGLASGKLLSKLEVELNISHNTARAHLRSMFMKADVSRQSQLVFVLANCVAALGR
jgi:DNA-binding CsgD family transcriptional regulator